MIHSLTVNSKRAFSLVELSIVLVILGLLVGGVLSGQSLIRASELRSVTVDYQKYQTSMGTFRDKYFALPGDMTNASAFGWKDAAGTAIPAAAGSGDGHIQNTGTNTTNEISLIWVELSSAGIIEGSFTLIGGTTLTSGTNNPRAKMNNANWNVAYLGTVPVASASLTNLGAANQGATENYYEGNYGNVLFFGTGTNALIPGGVLKSEEAWNIDTKIDDGKPQTGLVTALESQGSATVGSGCGNAAASNTATTVTAYDLTNTNVGACTLVFKTGY